MNTEGYEIESLKRVATSAPYTWKKAEFTSFRTTDIDYIFTNFSQTIKIINIYCCGAAGQY